MCNVSSLTASSHYSKPLEEILGCKYRVRDLLKKKLNERTHTLMRFYSQSVLNLLSFFIQKNEKDQFTLILPSFQHNVHLHVFLKMLSLKQIVSLKNALRG